MAIEEAITSLLSGVASGRNYWGRAPEDTDASDGAYTRLTWVSGPRGYTMAGADGYVAHRLQIDVFAVTYTAMRTAATAALAALSGYNGTVSGTQILGIFVDSERDMDASDAGEVSHLFRRSIDLFVHHGE